jgi:hypothetical protein
VTIGLPRFSGTVVFSKDDIKQRCNLGPNWDTYLKKYEADVNAYKNQFEAFDDVDIVFTARTRTNGIQPMAELSIKTAEGEMRSAHYEGDKLRAIFGESHQQFCERLIKTMREQILKASNPNPSMKPGSKEIRKVLDKAMNTLSDLKKLFGSK